MAREWRSEFFRSLLSRADASCLSSLPNASLQQEDVELPWEQQVEPHNAPAVVYCLAAVAAAGVAAPFAVSAADVAAPSAGCGLRSPAAAPFADGPAPAVE